LIVFTFFDYTSFLPATYLESGTIFTRWIIVATRFYEWVYKKLRLIQIHFFHAEKLFCKCVLSSWDLYLGLKYPPAYIIVGSWVKTANRGSCSWRKFMILSGHLMISSYIHNQSLWSPISKVMQLFKSKDSSRNQLTLDFTWEQPLDTWIIFIHWREDNYCYVDCDQTSFKQLNLVFEINEITTNIFRLLYSLSQIFIHSSTIPLLVI
jgi:hypothetical protein